MAVEDLEDQLFIDWESYELNCCPPMVFRYVCIFQESFFLSISTLPFPSRYRFSYVSWRVIKKHLCVQECCSPCTLTGVFILLQSTINKENFRDAQPDVLVHSMPDIISRFNELGIRFDFALRALCKKKGLYVEVMSAVRLKKPTI